MLFVYHIYYLREIGETRRWKQLQKSSFMELNPSMFGFPTNAGPTCVKFEASFFSGLLSRERKQVDTPPTGVRSSHFPRSCCMMPGG